MQIHFSSASGLNAMSSIVSFDPFSAFSCFPVLKSRCHHTASSNNIIQLNIVCADLNSQLSSCILQRCVSMGKSVRSSGQDRVMDNLKEEVEEEEEESVSLVLSSAAHFSPTGWTSSALSCIRGINKMCFTPHYWEVHTEQLLPKQPSDPWRI